MARFRTFPPDDSARTRPTLEEVRRVVEEATRPVHFFAHPSWQLLREFRPNEQIPWEVYRGHLLDERTTRERRAFESWNLYCLDAASRPEEPVLSVKVEAAAGELHVTRGLLCYVWEPYDAGGNAIETRQSLRWRRELVGTLDLKSLSAAEVRQELVRLLFQAVVGLSRLPLTSVEAPLPVFSLGQLAYFYRAEETGSDPMRNLHDLVRIALTPNMGWLEKVKMLEFVLRVVRDNEISETTSFFVERWRDTGHNAVTLQTLFRSVFVEVALSPYTGFADNSLAFTGVLVEQGYWTEAERADFLAGLLRQVSRHLSAYDLITFHHNGANYPDALLLDAVLKTCLRLAEGHPDFWLSRSGDDASEEKRKRLNRRGLRQGWLVRRFYEGHPVPDEPTSPGENARVLPEPHRHIPDEQIYMPHRRKKRLYDGDPLPRHLGENAMRVLRESVADLRKPEELQELGMALFLDRPLGVAKAPLEPDQTQLFSYEAFSRSLAQKRLAQLARDPVLDLPVAEFDELRNSLTELPCLGLPVPKGQSRPRPVVSLQDAIKASDDFLLMRTTAATVRDFLEQYDLAAHCDRVPLKWLTTGENVLLLGGMNEQAEMVVTLFDSRLRRRLELKVCLEQGYAARVGVEFPLGGLQVLRVWSGGEETGTDLRGEHLVIRSRCS